VGCTIRAYIPLLDAIPGEEQIADYRMSYGEAAVSNKARRRSNTVAYVNPLEIVPVKDFINARILLSQESDHGIAQLTNKLLVPPCFRVHYNADLYQAPVLWTPGGVHHAGLLHPKGRRTPWNIQTLGPGKHTGNKLPCGIVLLQWLLEAQSP